jgi:hypothetical protein
MISDVEPTKNNYDSIVILGSLAQSMRSRYAYLLKLLREKKIQTENIVFLVGARPTLPKLEDSDKLLGNYSHNLKIRESWTHQGPLPETETEAAQLIVEQGEWNELEPLPNISFVDTPMQQNKDNSFRRPNTTDTIVKWLEADPKINSILAISSNPYCGYQHGVLTQFLPKEWSVETIGYGSGERKIEMYFDTLARWLYQYRSNFDT